MNKIPFVCPSCGETNMVDVLNLDGRPLTQVVEQKGYICSGCERWEPVFFVSVSLNELLIRINKAKVGSTLFKKLLKKSFTKAQNLHKKFYRETFDGESRDNHKTTP